MASTSPARFTEDEWRRMLQTGRSVTAADRDGTAVA